MLLNILISFCLFNSYHHINAVSVSDIQQDTRELGERMSLLNRSQYIYI